LIDYLECSGRTGILRIFLSLIDFSLKKHVVILVMNPNYDANTPFCAHAHICVCVCVVGGQ
jgi:hypothetical protein